MATTPDFAPPKDSNYYPQLTVAHIENPNRFFAVPILGGLVKIISLIPVFIEIAILSLAMFLVVIINSFVVLFTGKYWPSAYTFIYGCLRLQVKTQLFIFGLTNSYPGFDFDLKNTCGLTVPMPAASNRLFAFPIFGFIARVILMIPYFIFTSVVSHAAYLAAIIASFPVCFSGKYPESMYEMVRDNIRVSFAVSMYMFGLSDTYPNFWISMHNKNTKIALLIAGAILAFMNFSTHSYNHSQRPMYYNRMQPTPIDQTNTTYPQK